MAMKLPPLRPPCGRPGRACLADVSCGSCRDRGSLPRCPDSQFSMFNVQILKFSILTFSVKIFNIQCQGVLGRLIRDSRNLVVIFCKYLAYALIALTHTCYLIKNYSPDELKKFLPLKNVKGMASETWCQYPNEGPVIYLDKIFTCIV